MEATTAETAPNAPAASGGGTIPADELARITEDIIKA